MPVKTRPSGPCPAEIMIVGEAPGYNEEVKGTPFVGTSGEELTKMLHEAGIVREACFLTNVCKYRPPGNEIEAFFLDSKQTQPNELIKEGLAELEEEIARCKPKMILALGNTALWALTGQRGITKWRGSMLEYKGIQVMPTYHPALILREWSWRSIAVHDLRRARKHLGTGWPKKQLNLQVRPTFEEVMDTLGMLLQRAGSASSPMRLASDIETRLQYISCHGIAWSANDCLTIPEMCVERPHGYFPREQEVSIWYRERELMRHPNVEVVGQNYLYDAQYFARRKGYVPRLRHDTMFMQHVLFAGLPKGLDFLSSMYASYHVYWKDEGKLWNPDLPEDQHWTYNGKDGTTTWELAEIMLDALRQAGLMEVYLFQMKLWHSVLRMMLRGVPINKDLKHKLAHELFEAITDREQKLHFIVGRELNVKSPKQMQHFFYTQLGMPVIKHRKTQRPTTNDEALWKMASKEPLLKPIVQIISDLRSLGVFKSNFIDAALDPDGRMRCSFNPAGTETYRFSSSESAFGTGTNLQNVPSGDEDNEDLQPTALRLPNIRKIFVPPPDYTIADVDLAGADAQVVAWEAGDEKLKEAFRAHAAGKGPKIHVVNSMAMFGERAGRDGKAQPYYGRAKMGVHLTNYGGKAKTMAARLGIPEWEAQKFQNEWFRLHPEIEEWHEKVEYLLSTKRQVINPFGYRRFYFDRIEGLLPEALAWVPQSTVACVANRALVAIDESPIMQRFNVQLLLQVHDSLVLCYPTRYEAEILPILKQLLTITVPYEDPLVIPWGLKTSTVSWGDCKERKWPT